MWLWWVIIPEEDFTDVTLIIDYAYWFTCGGGGDNGGGYGGGRGADNGMDLTLFVRIAKVKIVKEVIS